MCSAHKSKRLAAPCRWRKKKQVNDDDDEEVDDHNDDAAHRWLMREWQAGLGLRRQHCHFNTFRFHQNGDCFGVDARMVAMMMVLVSYGDRHIYNLSF